MSIVLKGDVKIFNVHDLSVMRHNWVLITHIFGPYTPCHSILLNRNLWFFDLVYIKLLFLVSDFELFWRCGWEISRFFPAIRQYFDVVETWYFRMHRVDFLTTQFFLAILESVEIVKIGVRFWLRYHLRDRWLRLKRHVHLSWCCPNQEVLRVSDRSCLVHILSL